MVQYIYNILQQYYIKDNEDNNKYYSMTITEPYSRLLLPKPSN